MTALRLGVVADDVTGACDLAGVVTAAGLPASVLLGPPSPGDVPADGAACVVVALRSRTAPVADAVAESVAAGRWLLAHGARRLYQKYCSTFDSTAAGNIGPVADALADLVGGRSAGTPATPAVGRTVYQGHLFVDGRLLSESALRDHPLTPMTDADLVRLLSAQTARPVGLVRWPAAGVPASETAAHVLLDALTDADLDRHAAALAGGSGLLGGASGLAAALARHWAATDPADPSHGVPDPSPAAATFAGRGHGPPGWEGVPPYGRAPTPGTEPTPRPTASGPPPADPPTPPAAPASPTAASRTPPVAPRAEPAPRPADPSAPPAPPQVAPAPRRSETPARGHGPPGWEGVPPYGRAPTPGAEPAPSPAGPAARPANPSPSAGLPVLPPGGGRVVLAGSCSARTREQIDAFPGPTIRIAVDDLAADPERTIADAVEAALAALAAGRPVLVTTSLPPDELRDVQRRHGRDRAAALAENALAAVATALADPGPSPGPSTLPSEGVRRFIVAGGETSGAVTRALGIRQVRVGEQVAPGVPWTVSTGPRPLALLLKSGNFGPPGLFTTAWEVAP